MSASCAFAGCCDLTSLTLIHSRTTRSAVRYATILLASLLLAIPASAQDLSAFSIGGGIGRADLTGEGADAFAGGSAGLLFQRGRFVATVDANMDVVSGGDTGPYYYDSSVDRCRDSRNGEFARDELCRNSQLYFAATGDVNYTIPQTRAFIGGGARLGAVSTPYVSGGISATPLDGFGILFKGRAWTDYLYVGALFSFPLN